MKFFTLLFFIISNSLYSQIQIGQDIDGEASEDNFGISISINADGSIVAVGADKNDTNGNSSGQVKVYQLQGSNWVQYGNTITGGNLIDVNDNLGTSLGLNASGNTIAIGAPGASTINGTASGKVLVYEYSSGTWNLKGDEIYGEDSFDASGESVSLSADGGIVAIGAPQNNGASGSNSGHVRIFQYQNGNWIQLGSDIDGEYAGDWSGESLSFSTDGNTVAIGSDNNDDGGTGAGHVRVFNLQNGNWIQLGNDINGENATDNLNISSLNADGSILAVGAPGYGNGSDIFRGQVKVYQYLGGNWLQMGSTILGNSTYEVFGNSLSLSADGTILAVGAQGYNPNPINGCRTRIYKYINDTWFQIGSDIIGEASDDRFGNAVSLDANGSTIAIGGRSNDNTNGSDSGHARIFDLNNVLNIDNLSLQRSISIYPNPAIDKFEITLPENQEIIYVEVYNQLGQLVINTTSKSANISDLTSGIYVINCVTNKGSVTKKLIVK